MLALTSSIALAACSDTEDNAKVEITKEVTDVSIKKEEAVEEKLLNNITLSTSRGFVRDEVEFSMTDLVADKPVELVWNSIDGKYIGEGLYAVIGPEFTEKEIKILEGIADAAGKWAGKLNVPEGFCGDFTL